MVELEIILTEDGSHTIRNIRLNETYHSIHGAIQESIHVFIEQGLRYVEIQRQLREIRILELGFGTGLNALLTAMHVRATETFIRYTAVESNPLGDEIVGRLNYPDRLVAEQAGPVFRTLHAADWNGETEVLTNFRIQKFRDDILEIDIGINQFDLVYFDAFAPSRQPELWNPGLLKKIEQAMKPGGVLVTYCARGQFKRDLKALGFQVETLPGPPGKKEMVRGLKS